MQLSAEAVEGLGWNIQELPQRLEILVSTFLKIGDMTVKSTVQFDICL